MTTNQTWQPNPSQMIKDLRSALYPNGVKHPQQGEWQWMIERVAELRQSLDNHQHDGVE